MSIPAEFSLESAEFPELPLLFPRFMEQKLVQRTLCFFRFHCILTEEGQRYNTPTFAEFCESIFARNLLTLTDSFFDCFLEECALFAEMVLCTRDGKPLAIKFRGKDRSTRWILASHVWGFPTVDVDGVTKQVVSADEEMLTVMRAFFEHCGVGTLNSPGAVGQALMRRAWKEAYGGEWKNHRHERPSQMCCNELRAHIIGARSDLFIPKTEHVPHVLEIDLKNAYAWAASMPLPTGKNFRFLAGSRPEEFYQVWFAECTITISEELPIGPFPSRGNDGIVSYPTAPGTYHEWLWCNEIENCRKAGCTVLTGNGHGWRETTQDLAHWTELVSWLRDTAPSHEVEYFVKKCIVAGLGRFYMPEIKYVLSEEWAEGATEVVYEGLATTWWAVPERDDKPWDMPHWFLWILSSVRCKLYEEMLARRLAGADILASDTDAFYQRAGTGEEPCYPCREQARTGDFRVKSHRTIPGKPTFPEKRHRNLEGAERHPGKRN